MGSLRETALGSRSFFYQLNPHWVLQLEVVGIYLPGTGTQGWGLGVGLGLLTPEISFLNFYLLHFSEGPAYSASMLLLPI